MHRPTYIPVEAWNLMSNNDKNTFFKNQKVNYVINIDSDSDEPVEKTDIKNEILNNVEELKKTYIDYYKNKLSELKYGYWKIRNNWKREQLQLINKDNINIPNKIYKLHYEYPIDNINNINYYKLFVDGREINKFDYNILLNEWDIPKEYIILIYLNNSKYPICYEYCFSEYAISIIKQKNGYNIDLNTNYLKIKDNIMYFNYQIFILQNL